MTGNQEIASDVGDFAFLLSTVAVLLLFGFGEKCPTPSAIISDSRNSLANKITASGKDKGGPSKGGFLNNRYVPE